MARDEEQVQQRVRTQVEQWRDNLLDLTGRNRLLRFRHNKVSSFEVQAPSAQAICDRLLTGRSRELTLFVPEERVEGPEIDPTATLVGLGGPRTRAGDTPALLAAFAALEGEEESATVYLTLGALQWRDHGATSRSALLLHVRAKLSRRGPGWQLALDEPALRVNESLLAHFEREYDVSLGEEPSRIESAGLAAYYEQLRTGLEVLEARTDDRIGIISEAEHARLLEGELDLTPRVLISDGPRSGILEALVAAEEKGLPLVHTERPVRAPAPPPREPGEHELFTTKGTGKEVRGAAAQLDRRATQEFMDKGLWVLYLGVGMLHWSDPADGRAEFSDSPLILVPVRLTSRRRGSEWKLEPTEDELLVNPALWLKLESELDLRLPEIDDDGLDVVALLDQVRALVGDRPGWLVEERVVLSTFSFHKEVMYRDLRDNMDVIVGHPVVASLARDPSDGTSAEFAFEPEPEESLDTAAPPEQVTTIRDADASQRQCILAARAGRSFVMDGPPGTGKSQTIANMIAELIADGKTVLFVSEKAAALDVVHDRLAQVGLDEYVLELHSHKTTRPVVAAALGAALMRRPRPAPQLSAGELHQAALRREALSTYAAWINEPREELGGRSLHHLLGRIAELQHLPQAPIATGRVDVAAATEAAKQLQATWTVVERDADFEWREVLVTSWGAGVEQRILSILEELEHALTSLAETAGAVAGDLLLDLADGARDAERLRTIVALLAERPERVRPEWLTSRDPDAIGTATAELTTRALAHRAALAALDEQVGDRAFADTPSAPTESGLIPDDADLGGLRRIGADAAAAREALTALSPLAADAAARLGLRATGLDLGRVGGLVELLRIASSPQPPRSAWLVPQVGARAREAVVELRPKLEQLRAAREEAIDFEESVLKLDLTELSRRFADEHTGLKKLGGAYKADRDELGATAPSIKPKAAVAQIDRALAWQTAHRELSGSTEAIEVLVDAWAGIDTDLDAAATGTTSAVRALELAGTDLSDSRRFAQAVAGENDPGALGALASDLDAALARTTASLPVGNHLGLELRELDARLTATEQTAPALASLVERTDAARGRAGDLASARAALAAAVERSRIEAEHEAHTEELRALLGEEWTTLTLDTNALTAATDWALKARSALGAPALPRSADRLARATVDGVPLDTAFARFATAEHALLEEFAEARRADLSADLRADFTDATALIERLRRHRGDIEVWTGFATARDAFADLGLAAAVRFCEERPVPAREVVDVLVRAALETLADDALSGSTHQLSARERDRMVSEFAADDRRIISDAGHRVMEKANALRPNTVLGVATIIANEAQKKRRHMPVSELLKRTAKVAQALKPCFMMSPLSVSQFLAPEMRFDVVIFDEASQVRPSDAINALYRGAAMIVAGDQKQLPPTDFFQTGGDDSDEWTDEALQDFDSVLDLAKGSGSYRALSLKWHYRSRHEHLIAFSNHRFYAGELVTFPGPTEQDDELGVAFLPVEGVYRRGTSRDNPVEALAIVERVFTHAERGCRSIGVVAFSEAQASLIEETLRRDARREDPANAWMFGEDRLGGLFVKNLENVQGDERDVVLFSIGYGPDEHDKLTTNFGPLNREGGWRRLNVAVTRARRRVEVICSFDPARLGRSNNRGVNELARYLDYAARGPVALEISTGEESVAETESPFEEAVLRVVRGWGYEVVPQVGTAGFRVDLGVRAPGDARRFCLGIECDGAMYHSSRVARDRDRLRQEILEGLGWRLHRIWGPSWYRDRPGEEDRLRKAIEASIGGGLRAASTPIVTAPVVEYDELDLEAPPTWTTPYRLAILPFPESPDCADSRATIELRSFVLSVVEEEGPIVDDLLVRRVIAAWEGSVVSERRRRAVGTVVESLVGARALSRVGDAVRLAERKDASVRVPDAQDERTRREVKHVPQVELAAALVQLVGEAGTVEEDELGAKAARIYGWARRGPAIQLALEGAVEELVASGALVRGEGRVLVTG